MTYRHAFVQIRDTYFGSSKNYGVLVGLTSIIFFGLLLVSCIPENNSEETSLSRTIVSNTLSLDLKWSEQSTLASSGTPMACVDKLGVIAGTIRQENEEIEGTILFNRGGEVLWSQPGGGSAAVALDKQQAYVFKYNGVNSLPGIIAYDIDSGDTQWRTTNGLDYRQGIRFLNLENGSLVYFSTDQINEYDTSNGDILSSESIPTENLYLRENGIDFYNGNGYHLYATLAKEPETYLWATEFDIGLRPYIYKDTLIVRMRQQVCSLKLDNGQLNWCSDKQVNSNIAVYGDIGYIFNFDGQMIAFQLEDGKDIGAIEFNLQSPASGNFITTCNGHLLAYLRSPDQIFWFDFVTEQ